jgi:hypothetical protein
VVHRAAEQRAERRAERLAGWPGRAAGIAVLALIATALLVFEYQFRHIEAMTASAMIGLLTPTVAATKAPIIWFGLGQPGAFGLVITPDCSSALLLVPLCLLGIGLMIPRRLHAGRVAGGLGGAAMLLVGGNMARIAVIALAVRIAGLGLGYQVGHLIIGSLVSIICIAASLVFLAWAITSPWRNRAGRAAGAVPGGPALAHPE